MSELTPELQVDITYLGDIAASDPPEVLAVAIRVIPTEQPTTEPDTTTPVQPAEPEPEEPVYEPFATVELPAQDPVPAEIPYDGVTLYGFPDRDRPQRRGRSGHRRRYGDRPAAAHLGSV